MNGLNYFFKEILKNFLLKNYEIKYDLIKIRIKFIFFCFCILAFIYSFKLFYSVFFAENLSKNIVRIESHKSFRRNIYDRNGVLLASSVPAVSIAVNSQNIFDKKEAAIKLTKVFPDLNYKKLIENLDSKKKFIWIKRNILPDDEKKLNEAGIPGLIFQNEYIRIYPHSNIAAFVLGYVDVDQNGISGIEKRFNDVLASKDLNLSLDIRAQNAAFNVLSEHVKKRNAEGGIIIVADLKKSEIIASVSLPDFNPHYPSKYSDIELFNRASLGVYELGSIWKPITIASALDSGIIKLTDHFDITPPLRIGRNSINDFSYPRDLMINAQEILKRSSNIGTAKIALKMGAELQKIYFKRFGFFDSIDIGIPEVAKNIFPKKQSDISVATMSYGHGFAITPMHFLFAFSALVNGGKLCKMNFIKNHHIDQFDQDLICTDVISKKTSDQMRALLRSVVEDGGARKADAKPGSIDHYCVGGKTGTAIKIKNGKYIRTEDLTSFVGAFPMYDPQYVIFVNLDNPKGNRMQNTGGLAAGPIAKELIDNLVPILGIQIQQERCFFE